MSTFTDTLAALTAPQARELDILPDGQTRQPSVEALRRAMELVRAVLFPRFFETRPTSELSRGLVIGVRLDELRALLIEQIGHATTDTARSPEAIAETFIARLPEVKRLLLTDVEAMYANDPAVTGYGEVISCYPVMTAMTHYRTAHELLRLGVPVVPRIITEMAHSATGIDIHPGASIGDYFSIDHGTGVVIGETCIIGSHVTLYQGVTLGAKNFALDAHGRPVNQPRHPILEDRVTVYANSTVLGRVTIGHDSIIGGNVWLTTGVAPHSRVLQSKAVSQLFADGLGI